MSCLVPPYALVLWQTRCGFQSADRANYVFLATSLYRRSLAQARSLRHTGARAVVETEIASRWRVAARAAADDAIFLTRRRDREMSQELSRLARLRSEAGREASPQEIEAVKRGIVKSCDAELRRRQDDRLRVAACTLRYLTSASSRFNISRAVLINMTEFRKVWPVGGSWSLVVFARRTRWRRAGGHFTVRFGSW